MPTCRLLLSEHEQSLLRFEIPPRDLRSCSKSALFGATVTCIHPYATLVGGIGTSPHSDCLGQSVLQWPLAAQKSMMPSAFLPSTETIARWPLMLGSSAAAYRDQLVIVGGGAATYCSNAIWTEGVHAIAIVPNRPVMDLSSVRLLESPILTTISAGPDTVLSTCDDTVAVKSIPRLQLRGPEEFRTVLENRTPVIIEGLDFGVCLTSWTPQYLCAQVGPDTQASIFSGPW